jgi:hypothetical protein
VKQTRLSTLPTVFSNQFYPPPLPPLPLDEKSREKSKEKSRKVKRTRSTKSMISISPNSSETITLKIDKGEGKEEEKEKKSKSSIMLYFAAEVENLGTVRQLNFNIRRTGRKSVSLTDGEQPLVTESGIFAVNWVTLDKSSPSGSSGVKYSVELINKGNVAVNILAYSLIASLIKDDKRKNCLTFNSNEAYACQDNENDKDGKVGKPIKLAKSSVTSFKIKAKTPRKRGQVLLTLNFELNIIDVNVSIYFDVRRDDGISITNGPQPWLISFGNNANIQLETNAVIIDPDAPKGTKFYTIEMINQDDADVGVIDYSITSESV